MNIWRAKRAQRRAAPYAPVNIDTSEHRTFRCTPHLSLRQRTFRCAACTKVQILRVCSAGGLLFEGQMEDLGGGSGKVRRTLGCWRHRLFFFPLEASCQNRGGGPGDSRTPGCRTRCLLQPPGVLGPGERCPPGGPGPGDSWSPGVPDHRLLVPGAVPGPGPWFLMSGVGGGGGFRARTPGSAIFS